MKKHMQMVTTTILALSFLACGPKLSKEKYVKAMSDLGCKGFSELSPQGEQMLKQDGVTQENIMEFRRGTKMETMTEVANEIATNVVKCHSMMSPHMAPATQPIPSPQP